MNVGGSPACMFFPPVSKAGLLWGSVTDFYLFKVDGSAYAG